MPASGQSDGLLSPPLETLQKLSLKSSISVDSKSRYFSSVSPLGEQPRRDSMFEGPSTISAALASPSCASNYESGYGAESQYFTPPEIERGNEESPYKAHSPSAASLNMAASLSELITYRKHKYIGTQQNFQDEHTIYQKDRGHIQVCQEPGKNVQQGLPGHNETCPANVESEPEIEAFAKRVRGAKNTLKNLTNIGDSSSQLFSATAINITTRRWSSIGIEAHEPTQSDSFRFDSTCTVLANNSQKRSNSWKYVPGDEDVIRSLRARLTPCQIPPNHLPSPVTIALRRASGVSTNNGAGLPAKPDPAANSPLLPQASQWSDTQPPVATYLMITGDVDFIPNLIQAGYDIRRTTVEISDRSSVVLRKPSVTNQGVIPQPGIPADLAMTIADAHQIPTAPRVSSKDPKLPDLKVKTGVTRKWSRSHPLENVPKVTWKETGSTGGHSISSKRCYQFDEQDKGIDKLSPAWLLAQSPSAPHRLNSPYARSWTDGQRKSNDDGDEPTTCHGTAKDPTEKRESSLPPSPNQTIFEQNPDSTSDFFKRDSHATTSSFTLEAVSFPPLLARKYTTDWISPLPNVSAPVPDDGEPLYGTRIDVQGSKGQNAPLLRIGAQDVQDGAPQRHCSPPNLDVDAQTRQESAFPLHPRVSPGPGGPSKAGNALGRSSGAGTQRKRSTQFVRLKISDGTLEHDLHEGQRPWVKPRKDSGWPAPKSPSSPAEEPDRRTSETARESRTDLLKSLTPLLLLPEADHSGIYAAFTGTQKEKILCEAGCQPEHVCGNTPSESRNPSTDWIGYRGVGDRRSDGRP